MYLQNCPEQHTGWGALKEQKSLRQDKKKAYWSQKLSTTNQNSGKLPKKIHSTKDYLNPDKN